MLKQIKLGFIALITVAFLASCKNDQDASREQAVQTATGETGAAATDPAAANQGTGIGTAAPTATPASQPAAPTGPTTTMQFEETEFNFGKVKDGEKVQHEYKFKNTGKEPLVISDAKGSCGCTVPQWPKEPIPVGGTGKILVEFDSKGKTGPQTKTVTITANTNPPQSLIYIKGEVIGSQPSATVAPTGDKKQ